MKAEKGDPVEVLQGCGFITRPVNANLVEAITRKAAVEHLASCT